MTVQFDLVVRGGTLVTPAAATVADIGVRSGRVAAVGDLAGATAEADFDARGLVVLPGAIDDHMHGREPGLTAKEDFGHASQAAAAGGVTTVLEMPNTVPPVLDAAAFHAKVAAIAPRAHVDFGLWGSVLGDLNRTCIPELAAAGAIGFKLFWGYALHPRTMALLYDYQPGDDVILPPDEGQIYDAFQAVAATGRPVAIHAEQRDVIARLTARERAAGADDYAAFLRSRPAFTEAMVIQAGLELAAATGVHLHVLHISSREGAAMVAQARAAGARVTGETCPHYLVLCDEDFDRLGIDMKVYPPIRQRVHQADLWQAIRSGAIQVVGSDHAPHTRAEKQGDIWSAPAGACGVQTLVPLMLDAVSCGRLTLQQAAALLAENPARLFGLYPRKGTVQPGADADLTIVDMDRSHVLDQAELLSKNAIAPFHGRRVQGIPVAAFLRGQCIMRAGQPVGPPAGRLVRPRAASDWLPAGAAGGVPGPIHREQEEVVR